MDSEDMNHRKMWAKNCKKGYGIPEGHHITYGTSLGNERPVLGRH